MKVLAIADELFTDDLVRIATSTAEAAGATVDVRRWSFPSRAAQQEQMLRVEQQGPSAVPEPAALAGPLDHDLLVMQFAPVPATAIRRAPNLRAIVVNRAGVENVDVEAAAERGIPVFNTEGRNARAVAEFTVGLMLAELRNIARGHAALKQGRWLDRFPNSEWTPELKDKTVGFVGYGRIARLVREMLTGFGCRFLAFDPHLDPAAADVELVDLTTLLRSVDVLSLHARLTPESRGLIGRDELALLKPTAIVVNTARAGLVDEAALVQALETGRIGGAALDVYEREPATAEDPLVRSDRATTTPHLAGTTLDGFYEGPRIVARTLQRLLDGDSTLRSVNGVELKELA
jgi:D-3-phosphoglycerate dehydrogenase